MIFYVKECVRLFSLKKSQFSLVFFPSLHISKKNGPNRQKRISFRRLENYVQKMKISTIEIN